jgi:hypothetical protein
MARHHRRKGRPCRFEPLEDRHLLAGDVTAQITNGDLVINGDKFDNGITIAAGTTAGTVVVTGVDAGGSATNVNGTANGAVTLSGFTGGLTVKMKGGNDTVAITGLTIVGPADLDGGKGNDSFTLSGDMFNSSLDVQLDKGADTLSLSNVKVTGDTNIHGGRGADHVTIAGSMFSTLDMALGRGSDSLDISGTTVSVTTRLKGGRGSDSFTNGTGNSLANLTQNSFSGGGSSTTPSANSPTLSISGAASVNEGSLYTLTLSAAGTGASTISKWTITWGDSSAAQDVTGNPTSVTHTFTDGAAARTISATATNPDGTFNAGNTVAVTVNNVTPSLSISGAASVNKGALYTLSLSSSDAGADTIGQWTINWGDGSAAQVVTGNPTSVTHTFSDGPATRTISATATDEDGTFNAAGTVSVAVNSFAPTLSISGPTGINEGSLYTLSLSSFGSGASAISGWTITWGDGSAAQVVTANPTSVTHTFADGLATRTISATATDGTTTVSAGNTVNVTVNNVPPALTISGLTSVNEGSLFTLNLSSSDPGADTISQWTINWGDGTATQTVTGNPPSVTHTFADGNVIRTIIATATDEDGTFAASSTFAVIVNNVAPTLTIGGAANVNEGALYTLNLSSADPGADTISFWTINWGDGTQNQVVVGNPASVTHTFADGPALRTINATATDEDSTFAANMLMVTVANISPALSISGAASIDEGSLYTLNLSSTDPGADTIDHWTITWGDGSPNEVVNGNPTSVTHFYADGPLDLTISATATDEDGTFAAGNTVSVTVQNVVPTTAFGGPSSVDEGTLAYWSLGPFVFDPGQDEVSQVIVHWGDGNVESFPLGQVLGIDGLRHTYDEGPSAYTISIDLVDEDGTYLSVATLEVTVNDVWPSISLDSVASIFENSAATLTGTYTDPGLLDAHQLVVNWDDPNNSNPSSFSIGATATLISGQTFNSSTDGAILTITSIDSTTGQVGFSVQHDYLDDGVAPGNGSASDTSTISITVVDDNGGSIGTTTVTVYDEATTIDLDQIGQIFEQDFLTITGTYTDVGVLDSQTLAITWNDPNNSASSTFLVPAIQDTSGTPTLSVGQMISSTTDNALLTITSIDNLTGRVGFSTQHQYLDDGFAPGDYYSVYSPLIAATITGDDSSVTNIFRYATVYNLAPTISLDPVADASEGGTATLTGSFTDLGLLDQHTISVDWGDPNGFAPYFTIPAVQDAFGAATLNIGDTFSNGTDSTVLTITSINSATGQVGFSVQHQYLDDGPQFGNGTASDMATITVSVADDDDQAVADSTSVIVHNVAPVVSLDSVPGVLEGGQATVIGTFTDSVLDGHTLTVNWGDPNDSADSTFSINPIRFSFLSFPFLSLGSVFFSTTDSSVLSILSVNAATGEVGFLVQHGYRDDGLAPGNGTDSDISAISVTVVDDDGESGTGLRLVTINNAAPTISLDPVPAVFENGTATLTGHYTDSGFLDEHTLTIGWGDPNDGNNSTFTISPTIVLDRGGTFSSSTDATILTITQIDFGSGQVDFSVEHRYADDGLAPGNATASDISAIGVTVADDDGQSNSSTRFITINNAAPNVALNNVPDISVNGNATVNGSYTDIGLLDLHTLIVQWADQNNSANSTFAIPATMSLAVGNTFNSTTDSAVLTITSIDGTTGQVGFSVVHQYTSAGSSNIIISVTDDDTNTGDDTTSVTVNP